MKAVVYTKYGPPEVLQLKEVEKPTPVGGNHAPSPSPTTSPTPDTRGLVMPKKVEYINVNDLVPLGEEPAYPDEARPFSVGATVERRKGYAHSPGSGEGAAIYDENKDTESIAFRLINKYENANGWNTDDNGGEGYEGYDIKATKGSAKKYIEVKSSRGWNCPDLSFTQLMLAKKKRSKYYLYRIFNLEKSESPPLLYIVKDPWGYLEMDVSAYKIKGLKNNPSGEIKKISFGETGVQYG